MTMMLQSTAILKAFYHLHTNAELLYNIIIMLQVVINLLLMYHSVLESLAYFYYYSYSKPGVLCGTAWIKT